MSRGEPALREIGINFCSTVSSFKIENVNQEYVTASETLAGFYKGSKPIFGLGPKDEFRIARP